MDRLHDSELSDVKNVAAEVCHELEVAIAAHDNDLRDIQTKYNRMHRNTAVAGAAAAVAALVPALAPVLGTVAPLALAGKYSRDKISEISEKRRAAHSLLGVLAISRRS